MTQDNRHPRAGSPLALERVSRTGDGAVVIYGYPYGGFSFLFVFFTGTAKVMTHLLVLELMVSVWGTEHGLLGTTFLGRQVQ